MDAVHTLVARGPGVAFASPLVAVAPPRALGGLASAPAPAAGARRPLPRLRAVRHGAVLAAAFLGGLNAALRAGAAAMGGRRPALRAPGAGRGRRVVAAAGAEGVGDVGVVFLSGGVGKRMGAGMPKQYIKLLGREIALHALEAFLDCDVKEIVIVCAEEWRSVFEGYLAKRGTVKPVIKYTSGGKERQDSVKNGLDKLTTEFAAVHDCARPLVTKAEIDLVIADARRHGAALLAVRTKATIKRASDGKGDEAMVGDTLDRNQMWEAQTPQVVRCSLLRQGFDHAAKHGLAVTDDVSLVESLGKPVKLSEGEYTNIKVTTPEDISVAETILRSRGYEAPASV